ncbi:MAG: FAD binding domain-containing protein [Bacteroidia bacterium]|nr:FAD binding domain-containing protein [Bacteroidia bacterium]
MAIQVLRPSNLPELKKVLRTGAGKNFRFIAGGTDVLPQIAKDDIRDLTLIDITGINSAGFFAVKRYSGGYKAGAGVKVDDLITNKEIGLHYPVLKEAALSLASNQIRQVATIGGNLCTASPSGDVACALMALEAGCGISLPAGKKQVSILKFFTGVRKTVLGKTGLLLSVDIPQNHNKSRQLVSGFIKVGSRRSMECSVVSLAFHLQCDAKGTILRAGIAIGAVAPTIRFARSAAMYLEGKNIHEIREMEKLEFAEKVLGYASPISDLRASDWYRKEVLRNICFELFDRAGK